MSRIMIRHFRRYDKQVGSDGNGGHVIVDVPKPGGLTLATVRDGDVVRFGFARCMKSDTFDKSEGREEAIRKLARATKRYNAKDVHLALDDRRLGDTEKMCGVICFTDIKRLLEVARKRA